MPATGQYDQVRTRYRFTCPTLTGKQLCESALPKTTVQFKYGRFQRKRMRHTVNCLLRQTYKWRIEMAREQDGRVRFPSLEEFETFKLK